MGPLLSLSVAVDSPRTPADAQREAAIAEFTQKMKDANYPALFNQAAAEFNVPADILKGVAFAETRWEHLTWPPGETESPATGMPRPYGVMSLWDNKFFGHSLIEAANLIGKDPEVLKAEPLQNIRGAAALLRKIYDQTEKPAGSTEKEVESWRYAIRKYSGIPEQDLNAQHALDVYVFMSRGFHEFGIEWPGQPVNLEPLRAETREIVERERLRKQLLQVTNVSMGATQPPPSKVTPALLPEIGPVTNSATNVIAPATVVSYDVGIIGISLKWLSLAIVAMAILAFATYWLFKKRNS